VAVLAWSRAAAHELRRLRSVLPRSAAGLGLLLRRAAVSIQSGNL
jgi:hypothetical protein